MDRVELLASLLDKYERVGITGKPGSGKSQLAKSIGTLRPVFACDSLLPMEHDALTAAVVASVPAGPIVVEGCAVPWAVRAGLKLDAVLVLTHVHEARPGAEGLGKGVFTVLAELAGDGPEQVYEMKTIQIDAFGEVGFDIASANFASLLTPDVTHVDMRLNSFGGDAIDGFAIYNLLSAHKAFKTITVIGEASSAASYILQAGDKRRINANAIIMTHRSQGGARGNAEDLEARGKALRTVDESMAGVYASRTGRSADEVRAEFLGAADKYWSAAEALAAGLVDEVLPDKAPAEALRACKVDRLRGAPASFLAAVAAASMQPTASSGAKDNNMDLKDLIGGLAALTPEQRAALVKHAESESKLAGLFVTPELEAQAKAGKAVSTLVGAEGEAAVGKVVALQVTAERVTAVEKSAADTAAKLEASELDKFLTSQIGDRLTPVTAKNYRAKYDAKALSFEGIKASVECLTPIPGTGARIAAPQATSADAKYNGKTYAELKPMERAALKKEDPALFEAMSGMKAE